MTARDDAEREQVSWVFGLTGGELNDEPWGGFQYNHDDIPEYAGSDHPDRYDSNVSYRTVVGNFLFGEPPVSIADDDGTWKRRMTYLTSGETECPLRPERVTGERCPLCDNDPGEPHGYIYIGDGWCSVSYRLVLPDDEV